MIHYSNHPPNVKDYCELRAKAGMSPKSGWVESLEMGELHFRL